MRDSFAEDIEKAADGPIVAAVIHADQGHVDYSYDPIRKHDPRFVPPGLTRTVLTWEQARPLLDYPYDNGFGVQDCHDVHVWTDERVVYVHEYDGATELEWLPRNPPPAAPDRGGFCHSCNHLTDPDTHDCGKDTP